MKIAVLISGGVDSSVALRLVKQAGHRDMAAFYLKIWLEDELAYLGNCPWEEDLKYARSVCEQAGVPLNVISLQAEYQERVVSAAVEELRAGRKVGNQIVSLRSRGDDLAVLRVHDEDLGGLRAAINAEQECAHKFFAE